jgi:hypothetical protein
MKITRFIAFAAVTLLLFACEKEEVFMNDSSEFDLTTKSQEIHPRFNQTPMENYSVNLDTKKPSLLKNSSSNDNDIAEFVANINAELLNQGVSIQLGMMEYYSSDGAGNTVFFNNRGNKQLGQDFVPEDPRRGGFSDIAYARDGTEGATTSGLSQTDTDGAILNAMNTWDNVDCSGGLVLFDLGSSPFDLGYVEALVTGGAEGSFFFTDIMHSGFNTTVTDAVFGAGSNVLGVTFTFWWEDANGPTDIDNNGKLDVAFRDIYYNDAYSWAIGNNIDVETVVLHEAGHGLSQGHFGKLSRTDANGKFHFSPRAVMNAGYTGVQTSIGKTDNAGHCSNWAQWPNN